MQTERPFREEGSYLALVTNSDDQQSGAYVGNKVLLLELPKSGETPVRSNC